MWLFLVQRGQQPNFPPDEASITKFYYLTDENTLTSYPQTQSQGIGGNFTTQSLMEDGINSTTGGTGRPRPACVYCSKTFGRIQELGRHVRDVHQLPHQCPFCAFMWTRPCKLKEHFMAAHVRSPEILEVIKPLRGQGLVKFLYGIVTPQPIVQAPPPLPVLRY